MVGGYDLRRDAAAPLGAARLVRQRLADEGKVTALGFGFLDNSARERQPLPTALPPPPASWTTPYARAAADIGLPADLGTAHAEAATFLDAILAGTTTGRWNPTQKCWTTP